MTGEGNSSAKQHVSEAGGHPLLSKDLQITF
jgi:hypothetical protein